MTRTQSHPPQKVVEPWGSSIKRGVNHIGIQKQKLGISLEHNPVGPPWQLRKICVYDRTSGEQWSDILDENTTSQPLA